MNRVRRPPPTHHAGNEPSVDGAPLAEGEVGSMTDGTAFLGLFRYFQKYGPVYKLCFGPKSFIVVSDPTIIKYILKTNTLAYDKVRTCEKRSIPQSIHLSAHQMAHVHSLLIPSPATPSVQGILAEILEPIMGKGLIPADNETWKIRRRAIVPAFHQKWLEHMIG